MPLSDIIDPLRSSIDDPSFPEIADWKKLHPGGRVIGHFPVYTPVEMVHAAGMLPVLVAGTAGRMRRDEADGYLQSFVCSVGRSTLELKLDGFLDQLDGMIFPSTCEISRGLSSVWERHDPEKPVIYIHFPQNPGSDEARVYLVAELNRLKDWLEKIAGSEISTDSMLGSFKAYNKRAELLDTLDRFRMDHPGLLRASESFLLRLAGMTISVEEHSELLGKAVTALINIKEHRAPKLRMVLVGAFCERPPVAMLETMENEGIAIVADDMLLGQRWWQSPLPITGDPIEGLADHYLEQSVTSSIVHRPGSESCDSLLEMIDRETIDGVIISSSKFCYPAHHDSTCLERICKERGLPFIRLEFEEEERVFESIRVQIEALLEARERLPIAGTDNGRNALPKK